MSNDLLKLNTPVVDVDLSATSKKTFMIKLGEGDIRPLKLDPSDLLFIKRLNEIYPKLQKRTEEAMAEFDIDEDKTTEEILSKTSDVLTQIDADMRKAMDEIFDTNVSEVCAPSGSMYDLFNGEFRFEHIIRALSKLYENNMSAEANKTMAKLKKHTAKYSS